MRPAKKKKSVDLRVVRDLIRNCSILLKKFIIVNNHVLVYGIIDKSYVKTLFQSSNRCGSAGSKTMTDAAAEAACRGAAVAALHQYIDNSSSRVLGLTVFLVRDHTGTFCLPMMARAGREPRSECASRAAGEELRTALSPTRLRDPRGFSLVTVPFVLRGAVRNTAVFLSKGPLRELAGYGRLEFRRRRAAAAAAGAGDSALVADELAHVPVDRLLAATASVPAAGVAAGLGTTVADIHGETIPIRGALVSMLAPGSALRASLETELAEWTRSHPAGAAGAGGVAGAAAAAGPLPGLTSGAGAAPALAPAPVVAPVAMGGAGAGTPRPKVAAAAAGGAGAGTAVACPLPGLSPPSAATAAAAAAAAAAARPGSSTAAAAVAPLPGLAAAAAAAPLVAAAPAAAAAAPAAAVAWPANVLEEPLCRGACLIALHSYRRGVGADAARVALTAFLVRDHTGYWTCPLESRSGREPRAVAAHRAADEELHVDIAPHELRDPEAWRLLPVPFAGRDGSPRNNAVYVSRGPVPALAAYSRREFIRRRGVCEAARRGHCYMETTAMTHVPVTQLLGATLARRTVADVDGNRLVLRDVFVKVLADPRVRAALQEEVDAYAAAYAAAAAPPAPLAPAPPAAAAPGLPAVAAPIAFDAPVAAPAVAAPAAAAAPTPAAPAPAAAAAGDGKGDSDEDAPAPVCGICMVNPKNCVLLPCGHTGCGECMQTWVASKSTCPFCQLPVLQTAKIFL